MDLSDDHLFLRACYGQSVRRTPVWIMRQAGRYLPAYQALRAKYDFPTLYKTPALAAEVTLQPVEVLGVDAAILFSDILVVPEAMGMALQFGEESGPSFAQPIRSERDLQKLQPLLPEEHLAFVLETISLVKRALPAHVPLLGFCGAPWTVAGYMIEGSHAKTFRYLKECCWAQPSLMHNLLHQITCATIHYCKAQIKAGVDGLQVFDTNAGILDEHTFSIFVLPYVQKLLEAIHCPNVPIIYFPKGTGAYLPKLRHLTAEVIGLDWTVSLFRARSVLGQAHALQGNLDPAILYTPPAIIREHVRHLLREFGYGSGHIANLGHGILPDVPWEHARAFVDAVKEESPPFHQDNTTIQDGPGSAEPQLDP